MAVGTRKLFFTFHPLPSLASLSASLHLTPPLDPSHPLLAGGSFLSLSPAEARQRSPRLGSPPRERGSGGQDRRRAVAPQCWTDGLLLSLCSLLARAAGGLDWEPVGWRGDAVGGRLSSNRRS
ncbi:hypothetical protein GUJ93_ZPchr0009g1115 [Zizania palustris]|uniref:Uncharacterized protein n=1 Tax=Zizania palustris TaxID=103762 RepID=A0A8J5S727_ZIZPA|nr:hypothetical protein GUJ93_ZPchr0009g1115 [Zizania palustris]